MSDRNPIQVVLEFYQALRDSRVTDMLALTDPAVVCQPLVRPGKAWKTPLRREPPGRLLSPNARQSRILAARARLLRQHLTPDSRDRWLEGGTGPRSE